MTGVTIGSRPTVELGLVFPTNEIGADPETISGFGRLATQVGFSYVLIYDHVVGANIQDRPNWPGPYTIDHEFHEPFVLLSYLAALSDLDLMTGVLILPQRQTVLVAKQAAALDVVSGGRFRLGAGIGWNPVEYESLGVPFEERGLRFEEQIALLRRLWTEPEVTFKSPLHIVDRAGIAPLPRQRPIPIWLGGWHAPRVLDRIGRLGDGWLCHEPIGSETRPRYERVLAAADAAGRHPGAVGLQGMVHVERDWTVDALADEIAAWRAVGADRVSLSTMRRDRSPAEHLALVEACRPLVDAVCRMG